MTKIKKVSSFIQLVAASSTLFLIAASLSTPVHKLIERLNDPAEQAPTHVYVIFWVIAPICAAVRCLVWVWFKKVEKECVEFLFKKGE